MKTLVIPLLVTICTVQAGGAEASTVNSNLLNRDPYRATVQTRTNAMSTTIRLAQDSSGQAVASSGSTTNGEVPRLSKPIIALMIEASKASAAKDWPTTIAKCKEAQAVPGLTAFDNYMIDRLLGVTYLNIGDRAAARIALNAVAHNPATFSQDRGLLTVVAMQLAAETDDNKDVIVLGKLAEQYGVANDTAYGLLAMAYYNTSDYKNATRYARLAIDGATAAGRPPNQIIYRMLLQAQVRQ